MPNIIFGPLKNNGRYMMIKKPEVLDSPKLDALLKGIEKPGRYIDHEFGIKSKKLDHLLKNPSIVNMALVFPDVYEIGMSNLGLQILYGIINKNPGFNAERAFSPWVDFEENLRNKGVKLFSLENRIFLDSFDVIGFNAAHEMLYTNILNILDLSGIKLRPAQRADTFPLICSGGAASFNPWPISAFMDFMVIGDGEEVITEILGVIRDYKFMISNSRGFNNCKIKRDILKTLSHIKGVFVPGFYSISYRTDNTVEKIELVKKPSGHDKSEAFSNTEITKAPAVKKAVLKNIGRFGPVAEPVIPNIQTIHDRLNIEIMRGCFRGCRFCQAGYIYRPVRQKKVKELIKGSSEALRRTGYDEVSFTSLSSSDYKDLSLLIKGVINSSGIEKISISLPSMRLDSFNLEIAELISSGRKTGLTFAPEAGSQRLRDIIKKAIQEEELLGSVKIALSKGWEKIKLYFMLGLPFETGEDVRCIIDSIYRVIDIARHTLSKRNFGRFQLSISINAFSPKPFTPFQWAAQEKIEELEKKIGLIRDSVKRRYVKLHWTSPQKSRIECALSRGDSRVADVVEKAWKKGAKFDNWSDFFDYDIWRSSFKDAGINLDFYTSREYGTDEILPWDVVDIGIKKEFFLKEYRKAQQLK